jgi:hypothetical protein
LRKLQECLLKIHTEVFPKTPKGRAVRYTLKNWTARYCEDGDLAGVYCEVTVETGNLLS